MLMEAITTTTSEATCGVFALTGPTRIRADDLGDDENITLYEERVDGDYEAAKSRGVVVVLTKSQPSAIVEGYGNYKGVSNADDLVFGYVAADLNPVTEYLMDGSDFIMDGSDFLTDGAEK